MLAQHFEEDLALLAFEPTVLVEIDGVGATCFSHGSPRSDEECVTERTPPQRVREFMEGVDAGVVVTAHVHVSYERTVDGVWLVGPGSVGLPCEGRSGAGAYWALLGPDVELRRTEYEVETAISRMRETDDPRVDEITEMMLSPPSRDDAITDAEERVFAG